LSLTDSTRCIPTGQNLGDEYERGDIVDLTSRLDELVTTEEVPEVENFCSSNNNFEKIIGAIEEIVVGKKTGTDLRSNIMSSTDK